ncbi:MAG: thermonuclease family protein [Dehalococcoidia bacterium]
MTRPDLPRGAGGRRRYVPNWPRRLDATRGRLGRVILLLGIAILFTTTTLRLADRDEPAPAALEFRGDGWYLASADSLPLVALDRVIDGDTLDVLALQTGLRVRAFGFDAPERGERCAEEATARLTALAGGGLRLMPDERLRDSGGRELRYLFTTDGRSIDAAMVDEGLATAWRRDGALRELLIAREDGARDAHRGCLWTEG